MTVKLSPMEQQLRTETMAVQDGIAAYHSARLKGQAMLPHQILLQRGMPSLTKKIQEFLDEYKRATKGATCRPILRQLSAEELAYMTLNTVLCESKFEAPGFKVSIRSIAIALGKEVESQLQYNAFLAENKTLLAKVQDSYKSKRKHSQQEILKHSAKKFNVSTPEEWDQKKRLRVGEILLNLAVEHCGLWNTETTKIKRRFQETLYNAEVLVPTPETAEKLETMHKQCQALSPQFFPTVIPPKDWTDMTGGGFYSGVGKMNLQLIKRRGNPTYLTEDFDMVRQCLNILQQTPWRINPVVMEVVEAAYGSHNGLRVLPAPDAVELPLKPWEDSREAWEAYKDEHPEEYLEWRTKSSAAYAEKKQAQAHLIGTGTTVGRARQLLKLDRFWFCWSCDYRGRVYPIQVYLNPQGPDLQKGLLEFADAKPLGDRGAYWLAVHGASTWGFDKALLSERVEWVEEHEQEILAIAANPCDCLEWTNADKPWQYLAFCLDWKGYVDSGRSAAYESRLPVGLDGTCNGLQHFAALLLDEDGAREVNMTPEGKRYDIYGTVAKLVNVLVEQDAAIDPATEDKKQAEDREFALLWQGKVDRSIVKRNVMTLPYGVTPQGMRLQLIDLLRKKGQQYLDISDPFHAAGYLVKKIEAVIDEVIVSAKAAKLWLRQIAKVFANAEKQAAWKTPSGFEVKQQYNKSTLHRVNLYWGEQRIRIGLKQDTDEADAIRAAAGMAPNFIHSLDATHMLMTVLAAAKEGITSFAMVHDSYGTHAGDIETLNRVLREQFVALYSKDLLADLLEQAKAQLPEALWGELPEPLQRGSLDLEGVKDSAYFFAP